MFQGRKLLIVTMHGKERAIAPLAAQALGVECVVADGFDTDKLGTFTGERKRLGNALETLRKKCLEGLAMCGGDLAIASEGSFGPHPSIYIAPSDDELVMLMDTANNIEIVARELTVDTNFSSAEISCQQELDDFLRLAKFPGHAVIIRKSENDYENIVKGINDEEKLAEVSNEYFKRFGKFFIETDMRAMHNPSRMHAISRAMVKLLDKVNSCCPVCESPGFGVTSARPGLPCSSCRFPTESTLAHIYICVKCDYQMERLHPFEKQFEDPMYCNICNP